MNKLILEKNIKTSVITALLTGLLFSLIKGGGLVYHLWHLSFPYGNKLLYFLYFCGIYSLLFSGIGLLVGILATLMSRGESNSQRIMSITFALCLFIFLSPWGDVIFTIPWGKKFLSMRSATTVRQFFFYGTQIFFMSICINIGVIVYFLAKKLQLNLSDNRAIKIICYTFFALSLMGLGGVYHGIPSSKQNSPQKLFTKGTTVQTKNIPAFKGKNIILIVIDTLRADHLSCYGYERKTSPNIDNFASGGVLFTNAVVQQTKTSPSVASILTGTHSVVHGVTNALQELKEEVVTLPEVLKRHGYKTGSIVANGNIGHDFNFDQGFDKVYEMWKVPGGRRGVKVTDTAIEWLENNQKNKFFLYIHYWGPHAKFKPPAPYNKLFFNDEFYGNYKKNLGLPRKLKITKNYWNGIRFNVQLKGPFENDYDYYISQYDGEIRHHDESIANLFNKIKELGLDKNTLIILTADHGEDFGENDAYFGHGSLVYESCARVPLIISNPQIPGNRRLGFLAQSIDIFPTVLDLLGLKREKTLQGNSLKTVLFSPGINNPDYEEFGFISGVCGVIKAIRTREWKLIYTPYTKAGKKRVAFDFASLYSFSYVLGADIYYHTMSTAPVKNYNMMYQLYNIKNDPDEQNNLFYQEPELAFAMKEKLHKWLSDNPRGVKMSKKKPIKEIDKETRKNLRALGYIN